MQSPPSNPVRTAHAGAAPLSHVIIFRVRYSETDQMGTFYNSRALEWFECGRTEFLRHHGLPYADMEARGLFLPLVEAHVEFHGRARYDDLLEMTTRLGVAGRARVRLEETIVQAGTGKAVAAGYTVHAFTDREGRPVRPPAWFRQALGWGGQAKDQGPGQTPEETPPPAP
ncbi:MAG: acyl-CoA thioesterase [Verrucomicrobia bacterium]|nr:acyl-CoA thioesterase [Verrucomicrobiota bacterium]